MDRGIQKCMDALVEALKHTRESVKEIKVARDWFRVGESDHEYMKEVAEITFDGGGKMYADIGGDSNLAAIYDVISVLMEKKEESGYIQRIEYLEDE